MNTESNSASTVRSCARALAVLALAGSAAAQLTRRVSVDSGGTPANGTNSRCCISANGRFVAFMSDADDLVPGDANARRDVFLHDRWTATTERVSVSTGGVEGDNHSFDPALSADGRYVAFGSSANNLIPVDGNGANDVFVRDRQSGTTERVSVNSAGVSTGGDSRGPAISQDGRFVVFWSGSTGLVPGDTNLCDDIFLRDRQLSITERVSVDSSGAEANWDSGDQGGLQTPSISADGRYVAFQSRATNLVPGDTNGSWDIFVRDRQLSITERVSVSTAGTQGNNDSFAASISEDGRYVVFESNASTLVGGDSNTGRDIFLRDRQLGTTERVSVDSSGLEANGSSYSPWISPDGRYVGFYSEASNLVAGDTNGVRDVFVRDRQLSTTERASLDSTGAEGNAQSGYDEGPSLSADGRFVAFSSEATNLVAADTNGQKDIFVHDRNQTGFTSLCDPGVGGVSTCPCSNPPSGSGRGCDNSAATGGASLSATGIAYLTIDSLVFTTAGEKPTATSVLLQGTTSPGAGVVYGQGVRCVGGTMKRLFTKAASGGSITAPNFGGGDPTVSARSAAKGSPISAGQTRWYLVFYRDPTVLGGCPSGSTFNATQTGRIDWSL